MTTTEQQNNNTNNKRIKWAKSFSPAGHLQKRSSTLKPKAKPPQPIKTSRHDQQLFSGTVDRKSEIRHLEKELGYLLDTLATISVMYDSILHAYNASKSEMDRVRCNSRLGEMEKELLTAYDDLTLQVTHLQHRIDIVERRLFDLNAETPSPSSAPILMSDGGGNESPLSALSYNATPTSQSWPDKMILVGCPPAVHQHQHQHQQQQQQQQPWTHYHYHHGQDPYYTPALEHHQQQHLLFSSWDSMYNSYFQS